MASFTSVVAAGLAGIVIGAGGYAYYVAKTVPEGQAKALIAWSDVENQFKARAQLTPKMIAVVQSINDTQKPLIEDLKAGQAAVLALAPNPATPKSPEGIRKFMEVQDGLSKQMGRIYDFLNYYPEKARDGDVRAAMSELEKQESAIVVSRRTYSSLAGQVNGFLTQVPQSWIAAKLDPKPVKLAEKFEAE